MAAPDISSRTSSVRPEILFPLFAPVTSLPGIGARLARLVERVAGPQIVDLLWHLPNGLIDRRLRPKIATAPAGEVATITVTVEAHLPPHSPRHPYKVRCADETGFLHLVFFHARRDWLEKLLPPGQTRIVKALQETGSRLLIEEVENLGDVFIAEMRKQALANPVGQSFQGLGLVGGMEELNARRGQLQLPLLHQLAELALKLVEQLLVLGQRGGYRVHIRPRRAPAGEAEPPRPVAVRLQPDPGGRNRDRGPR